MIETPKFGEDRLVQAFLAPLAGEHPAALGLADDCAVLSPPPGYDLVLKTDPIVSGLHFFADDAPEDIAWKALAVNVSDLAAKGAVPEAYLMSLAFPAAPEDDWMAAFSAGLRKAQQAFGIHLIGGDTDRCPGGRLTIAITAMGYVEAGRAVRRATAKPGDKIFVTGTIGDASLGLRLRSEGNELEFAVTDADAAYLSDRYLRPQPRLGLRQALLDYASAAMDLSDGLVKDAARMCRASKVDGTIELERIPASGPAQRIVEAGNADPIALITAGDDYEILAAVAPGDSASFAKAASVAGISVCDIGSFSAGNGVLQVVDAQREPLALSRTGFDHFG